MTSSGPSANVRQLPVYPGAGAAHAWLAGLRDFGQRKPLGLIGGVTLVFLVAVAVFAPLVAPFDPTVQDIPNRLRPPGGRYLFGTDTYGRDVFSQIVYGGRVSLYVGLLSVVIGTFSGVIIGVASGYLGGLFDLLVQRLVDALLGFPPLVLALVLVVSMGPSINSVVFAIGITYIPRVVRLARASALTTAQEMYVDAARAMGCGGLRIMVRHVVPNSLTPVVVLATGYLGTAIVAEASLSFLGLGVPPPNPTWGGMLQTGTRGYLESAPWLTIYPGLALSAVVFAFGLLGDALRDVWDPRLRNT